jgi:hypothetical protein
MADEKKPLTDDDLLADAIPIEEIEEDEDEQPRAQDQDEGIELVDMDEAEAGPSKIQRMERQTFAKHEWTRAPNKTGTGATHIKTFVAKLRADALEHMDEQINTWLDDHPDYEVKYVTTVVGELTGKTKEPALFVTVWI